MKFIGLATIFSMLFSFSALAGNGNPTIKTRHMTICKDIFLYKKSAYYSSSIITFSFEDFVRSVKDISGSRYVFIQEYNDSNDRLVFSKQRKEGETHLLEFKVTASGTIGSPEKWEDEDEEEKVEGISETKWVQFHISANDHTSPVMSELVGGANGKTVYGICSESFIKKTIK